MSARPANVEYAAWHKLLKSLIRERERYTAYTLAGVLVLLSALLLLGEHATAKSLVQSSLSHTPRAARGVANGHGMLMSRLKPHTPGSVLAPSVAVTFTVTSTADSGAGTLRQAIIDANNNAGNDTIAFNIGGTFGAVKTINLLSALPTVTGPVNIDGYSQPGSISNTTPAPGSINATPLIELNGSGAGANADGLSITAGGSTVKGLIINRFSRFGIQLSGSSGNRVEGNFIGTDSSGTSDLGNSGSGISISSSMTNTVGGTTAAARNLISGNNAYGVSISATSGANVANVVQGNLIGTKKDATTVLGNNFAGVNIFSASGNTVGDSAFAGTLSNVIAFNGDDGVAVVVNASVRNAILQNSIHSNAGLGIDLLGSDGVNANDALDADAGPNNLQNFPVLTFAASNSSHTIIRGTFNSTPSTAFTVRYYASTYCDPSGNGEGQTYLFQSGQQLTDSNGNLTLSHDRALTGLGGLYITATLTDPSGNTSEFSNCVRVHYEVANTNDSGVDSLRQAIIDANNNGGADGISFAIAGTDVHTITPASPLPLITDQLTIDGYTQPGSSPNTLATGNNAQPRILLDGSLAGANADGLRVHANSSTVRGLIINRFSGNGITLGDFNNAGFSNMIEGNFIGTDSGGIQDLGNGGHGVFARSSSNTIGGTTPGARNLISGNNASGISIGAYSGNVVRGNYIGTDKAGTADLGNSQDGVTIAGSSVTQVAASNVIGGSGAGAPNVISGNNRHGILLSYNTSGNAVRGNYIGTTASGNNALGNSQSGVAIQGGSLTLFSANHAIGGYLQGEGNTIAYNGGDGVTITGDYTTGNQIVRNSIHSNGGNGVSLTGQGTGNMIFETTIHSNTGLGIDLGNDGVTPNDAGDGDTGPNNLQNFPVITSVTTDGNSTTVEGTFDSTSGEQYIIEIFRNVTCDASGHGEGATLLGSAIVGSSSGFTRTFDELVPVGQYITSKAAVQNGGNTSEFSACFLVSAPTATPTRTSTPSQTSTPTHTGTATRTRTATPVGGATSTPCAIEFTDVPPSNNFYENVRCLACREILSGYTSPARCPETGAPCFRPGDNITRGQMAKIVSNAAGFDEPHAGVTFTDVPATHTFYIFIQRLASRGVVSGYNTQDRCPATGAPCFQPEALVTRGQMSKFVALAAAFTEPVPAGQQSFVDVPSSDTFWQYIERLSTRGVVGGYSCGGAGEPCPGSYFRPNNFVTRGQASKFVSLAFFPNCQTPARNVGAP